jgi:serine protease
MKRFLLAAAAIAAAALAEGPGLGSVPLDENPRPAGDTWPGEVIVEFTRDLRAEEATGMIREAGGERARRSARGGRWLVELEAGRSVETALARFRAMPEVDYAEPNGVLRSHLVPNDPLYSLQWHLRALNAERAWDIQRGDASVAVAVLDSGIAFEDFGAFRRAPDFAGTAFLPGLNVFDRSPHANDDNFHGTHVAGVVAQATNNGAGVAGLAHGCALVPVKVLDTAGLGSFFGVAEGIDYAAGLSAVKVINLSLGGEAVSETVRRAIDRARSAGITLVASSGNDNAGTVSFPASADGVIAVGAVDARRTRARYSNYGTALDVVAYGGDLRRDDDDNGQPDGILQQTFDPAVARGGRYDAFGYYYVTGTSQAAPQVAALAALLYRQGITDPAAIQKAIESTAEDVGPAGRDDEHGHGLIRPVAALSGLGLGR